MNIVGKMKFVSVALATALLSACTTSQVVQTHQIGDEAKSCEELKASIAEAQKFEQEARKNKGVTGTNVAAAVFFWPAMIATYTSAEEAEDAARERQMKLVNIANSKGCQ